MIHIFQKNREIEVAFCVSSFDTFCFPRFFEKNCQIERDSEFDLMLEKNPGNGSDILVCYFDIVYFPGFFFLNRQIETEFKLLSFDEISYPILHYHDGSRA